jgi:hypothetical protein
VQLVQNELATSEVVLKMQALAILYILENI